MYEDGGHADNNKEPEGPAISVEQDANWAISVLLGSLGLTGSLAETILLLIVASLMYIILIPSLFKAKYDLHGKHVLITGGSSGIGLEVAKQYISRGASVTIMARNKQRLAAAVSQLEVCVADTKSAHSLLSDP